MPRSGRAVPARKAPSALGCRRSRAQRSARRRTSPAPDATNSTSELRRRWARGRRRRSWCRHFQHRRGASGNRRLASHGDDASRGDVRHRHARPARARRLIGSFHREPWRRDGSAGRRGPARPAGPLRMWTRCCGSEIPLVKIRSRRCVKRGYRRTDVSKTIATPPSEATVACPVP
jgi:hypothetical protein